MVQMTRCKTGMEAMYQMLYMIKSMTQKIEKYEILSKKFIDEVYASYVELENFEFMDTYTEDLRQDMLQLTMDLLNLDVEHREIREGLYSHWAQNTLRTSQRTEQKIGV
jgi:pectate lyase